MALTLTEAAKLSNDEVLPGVIANIVEESPLMGLLPFIEINGNALTYNRENVLPGVNWYDPGDTWVEDTPTFTQLTATLKILGGDADVDQYLARTRSNVQDLEAAVLSLKAKAFAREWESTLVYGDVAGAPKEIDGLHEMIEDTTNHVHAGTTTTPGVLTASLMDQLVDLIKPGKPDVLLCSKRTRRIISTYQRSTGSGVQTTEIASLGRRAVSWDDIPILVSDYVLDTETIATDAYALPTGGSGSSVFAIKFGEGLFAGLHNGALPQVEDIGPLETKDARRWRLKGYVGVAQFQKFSLARIDGVSSGAMTA